MPENLVIVRAGDGSLHPQWLDSRPRSWDLIVSYYGDNPDIHHAPGVRRIDTKGGKMAGLALLFEQHPELLDQYQYIWLPDDDVATSSRDINQLFETMERHQLSLAQPALSVRSHISWFITLQNPLTSVRWTNFIEVMAPCFHTDLLRHCLPTFPLYISAWGLDWVWPQQLPPQERKVAILDRIAVTHTRPVGGPIYGLFSNRGFTAADELGHVLKHFPVDTTTRTFAAKLRIGPVLREGPALRWLLGLAMPLIALKAVLVKGPSRQIIAGRARWLFRSAAALREYDFSNTPDGSKLPHLDGATLPVLTFPARSPSPAPPGA